jgi:hypothetical protein
VVKLIETAARLPGRKRWLYLTAAIATVALFTFAYAAALAVAATLRPAPDHGAPECPNASHPQSRMPTTTSTTNVATH